VYTRERKHIVTKWSRVTCLASHLLLLKVFFFVVLNLIESTKRLNRDD
jgi:hypothetical protein